MAASMGAELFDEFAVEYLQRYPSHSYTLNDLGANFPKFLAETRPTSADEDNSWLDFLVDLAKLEWCFAEVFDGPGAENQALLGQDQLQGISADAWADGTARAGPLPANLAARFSGPGLLPRHSRSRRGGSTRPRADLAGDFAAKFRGAALRTLARTKRRYWERFSRGRRSAMRSANRDCRTTSMPSRADLRRWFHEWTAEGFFLTVKAS